MTIITITRAAKCKDCFFIQPYRKGKLKRHYCSNRFSKEFSKDRTLKDLVCKDWRL